MGPATFRSYANGFDGRTYHFQPRDTDEITLPQVFRQYLHQRAIVQLLHIALLPRSELPDAKFKGIGKGVACVDGLDCALLTGRLCIGSVSVDSVRIHDLPHISTKAIPFRIKFLGTISLPSRSCTFAVLVLERVNVGHSGQ